MTTAHAEMAAAWQERMERAYAELQQIRTGWALVGA